MSLVFSKRKPQQKLICKLLLGQTKREDLTILSSDPADLRIWIQTHQWLICHMEESWLSAVVKIDHKSSWNMSQTEKKLLFF